LQSHIPKQELVNHVMDATGAG